MPAHLAHLVPAAVVFDMDGTLLDTEPLYKQAMVVACAAQGREWSDEVHARTIGVPGDEGDRIMEEALGPTFDMVAYRALYRDTVEDLIAREITVKPGVHEFLDALEARGIGMAIATSTRRAYANPHLEAAGIAGRFATIVTRDDVQNGKPHPESFLRAAEGLGVDPAACIAIEDSYNGVRAAHAAGMKTVMVPDLLPPTGEMHDLCVAVLDTLHDLRAGLFAPV